MLLRSNRVNSKDVIQIQNPCISCFQMVIEGRSSIFLILDRDSFFNSVVNNVSFHLIILNIISAPRSLTAPDQNQLKKKKYSQYFRFKILSNICRQAYKSRWFRNLSFTLCVIFLTIRTRQNTHWWCQQSGWHVNYPH